jgi:hypothetical protein
MYIVNGGEHRLPFLPTGMGHPGASRHLKKKSYIKYTVAYSANTDKQINKN